MKKIYSIIALIAMLCTSMCMFTSCGDDDGIEEEDTKQPAKLAVSANVAPGVNLSSKTLKAVGDAMKAAQNALAQIDYTAPEGVEGLMADAIETEVKKLDFDVKFELKNKNAKIQLKCSNTNPPTEYIFDCSELYLSVPQNTAVIKFAKVHPNAQNHFSAESVAKLQEVADYLNEILAGVSIETDLEHANDNVGNLALEKIREKFTDLNTLPEASNESGMSTYICLSVVYATAWHENSEASFYFNYLFK